MPLCVEECLRYVSPVQMTKPRFATRGAVFDTDAHSCLGFRLVRMEAAIAFESILARFSGYAPRYRAKIELHNHLCTSTSAYAHSRTANQKLCRFRGAESMREPLIDSSNGLMVSLPKINAQPSIG